MRTAAVLALAALIVGCGSSGRRSASVAGGCAAGSLRLGSGPRWAAGSNPPASTRYTVAAHDTAVAFLFGYPLRAGNASSPFNKILWIVRTPGSGLTIRATPLHARRPVVAIKVADSAGAQIYPSYVNVPAAGCWHMTVRWAGGTDSVNVPYGPSCPVTSPGGPRPTRLALENLGQPLGNPTDAGWYGNGTLWTTVPPGLPADLAELRTTGPGRVSMIGIKMGWQRARPGAVSITARPVHGPPARFIARVGTVQQYGRLGFVPSNLMFERAGCWRITARLAN